MADRVEATAPKLSEAKGGQLPPVDGIPRHLYKYVSAKNAVNILLTGKIYFARRHELNDPLEGEPAMDFSTPEKTEEFISLVSQWRNDINDPDSLIPHDEWERHQADIKANPGQAKKVARLLVSNMDKWNLGIFCMTERPDSFPMWAHYAGQHTGCCIRFNMETMKSSQHWEERFPFLFPGKIEYSNTCPEFLSKGPADLHRKGSVYMTKYKEWKYEYEWRWLMYDDQVISPVAGGAGGKSKTEKQARGAGRYLCEHIDGIILGSRMTETDKDAVVAAACKHTPKIHIQEANPITVARSGMEGTKMEEPGYEIQIIDS